MHCRRQGCPLHSHLKAAVGKPGSGAAVAALLPGASAVSDLPAYLPPKLRRHLSRRPFLLEGQTGPVCREPHSGRAVTAWICSRGWAPTWPQSMVTLGGPLSFPPCLGRCRSSLESREQPEVAGARCVLPVGRALRQLSHQRTCARCPACGPWCLLKRGERVGEAVGCGF